MPVLPLIDLLIMVGWTSLMGSGLLKAIYLSTSYRPTVLTLGPADLLTFAGVCLLFALTLAARTWVKYHEPQLMAARRRPYWEPGEPGSADVEQLPAARRASENGS